MTGGLKAGHSNLGQSPGVVADPWVEPYLVQEKVGDWDYPVATPDRRCRSRLCHINKLKPYYERGPAVANGGGGDATVASGERGPVLKPLVVYADHNPLVFVQRTWNKNRRLMNWSLKLQAFNVDIRHVLVDVLSHL